MRLISRRSAPHLTRPHRGASLIELMVGITLLALLVGLGVPTFSEWLQNARIRAAAESIQTGLQQAKAEAVRRNRPARFQLVSSLDGSCTTTTTGTHWLVNLTSNTSPDGQCGNTPDDATTPFILQRSPAGAGGCGVCCKRSCQKPLLVDFMIRQHASLGKVGVPDLGQRWWKNHSPSARA